MKSSQLHKYFHLELSKDEEEVSWLVPVLVCSGLRPSGAVGSRGFVAGVVGVVVLGWEALPPGPGVAASDVRGCGSVEPAAVEPGFEASVVSSPTHREKDACSASRSLS